MTQQKTNKFQELRQQKLDSLRQLDVDPYGQRYDGAESAVDIKNRFVDDRDDQRACAAGRIVLLRDIGKLIFITLRDSSGNYRGTLEVSQDITGLRALEGEKRLLDG